MTRTPTITKRLAILFALVAALLVLVVPGVAHAEEPEAFARVVVDSAELRSGPGVSFRVIYNAQRGETLAIDGRQSAGFWLRVILPDGRTAYALGDEVQVFAVRADEPDAPSRPGFFATPPLQGAHGGLAIVFGLMSIPILDGTRREFGYIEARPSIVIHPSVTLEGFIGDALTADGAQILYGGGGLSVLPNADSFILKREDLWVARAGGGLLMALRGRILVRMEVTNPSLFAADTFKNAQTYSIGLGVYF